MHRMDDSTRTGIRAYEPDDAGACRDLWRLLTQHHRDLYDNPTIGGEDAGVHFDAYLQGPKYAGCWVAVTRAGEVVGMAGLLVEGREAEVEPVVVAVAHRGTGIGRRLVEHAIGEARGRGAASVRIRPVARNARAIRHFHAAGFRIVGQIEMFQMLRPSRQEWKPGITFHGLEFLQ